MDSQIAAMVYFDLILRSVTEPGLLNLMIKFLLDGQKFDGQRIIDVLIERINSPDPKVMRRLRELSPIITSFLTVPSYVW